MILFRNILSLLAVAVYLLFSHIQKESIYILDYISVEKSSRTVQNIHVFRDTVKIKDYFKVMDNIVERYDSILTHHVSEHLIIRNNPWVIDSLAATDYYYLKELGITNLNPKELPIFKPGDFLVIPNSATVDSLHRLFQETYLDLNIPEFKLRVIQEDSIVYDFSARVGRNERKYLAMADRIVDLRTETGKGTIVQYSKDPTFINPVNNQMYHVTHRDDGVLTALPNIPWLVPEINGIRNGQLIHPTTNIETLGKAYSNGCIGVSEASAWYIYYHAPLGTRIVIRYDLEITDKNGDTLQLQNIYNR